MSKVYSIGVRREDKNRWERRAPLSPSHVAELHKKGVKVVVQPSNLRTYNDTLYAKAGAVIQEDLTECDVIVAVKEVPMSLLYPTKTYIFFSHTIKAQPFNMPMLDDVLSKKIRLIDYERICDKDGKRLVRFGQFAGYAGMIDMLHALGDRLLAKGFSTPLLHSGYSYCYSCLDNAKSAVKAMGEEISNFGLPKELCPMTFVFTSEGAVSQGAQDIFSLLPHKWVTLEEMTKLCQNKDEVDTHTVYGVVITSKDMVEHNDASKKFDKKEYYEHPERYHSVFAEKIVPYTSVIINCMYWDARFPRLLTSEEMKDLWLSGKRKLLSVADISADIQGSIEFLVKTTSIDQPLYVYDPKNYDVFDVQTDRDFLYKDGILFLAVDNLPTEFPREATQWFGDHLLPFMEKVVKSDPSKPYDQMTDLPIEIHKAVIAAHGSLTPPFEYIAERRAAREKDTKKILILGAGLVAAPAVEYLSRNPAFNRITLADVSLDAATRLAGDHPNVQPVKLDVSNDQALEDLIAQHFVVVCLVPASFNTKIAKICLKKGVNMVTASYIPPAMEVMHEEVKAKGLTFLNEMGLDPGIDHLEAMHIINEVKENGGRIRSFVSWCGGLPAPESSDNPLGYKFSWSARGVLGAATNPAKYKIDEDIVEVTGNQIFKKVQQVEIFPSIWLEGVPNRDSLIYAKAYGIDDADTVFRGTLRFRGFCQVMEAAVDIGLLDDTLYPHLKHDAPDMTWDELMRELLTNGKHSERSTQHALRKKLRTGNGFPSKGYDDDKINQVVKALTWLGVFSSKPIKKKGTYIDTFCELLIEKLKYEPHEKDMIILHHIFEIEWPDNQLETRSSTLVQYGDTNGRTVMSSLVGLPIAIAAELLLDGAITEKGVIRPVTKDIVLPMLDALKNEGVTFITKSHKEPW